MYTFEVRQVEGWMDGDGWTWNNSFYIGKFTTKAETDKNVKRAFIRYLNKNGIYFKQNRTIIQDYCNVIEVQDRKTKEPLFAAIFCEEE